MDDYIDKANQLLAEVEESKGHVNVHSVKELLASKQPKEWVVDEFGAAGACVLLAADKGTGKSSLMYGMAAAIQSGDTFMGQLKTQKRNVLVWQADEPRANATEKLEAMGIDSDFDFILAEDGYVDLDFELLTKLVVDRDIGVVFLDSVSSLLMGRGISMRDPEFAQSLYDLTHWSAQHNVLSIISCHLRKPDESKTSRTITADSIIGSGLQSAAVTDIWSIEKPSKAEFEEHYVMRCLGKRNCRQGTVWNLQGSEEDFSWKMVSVGEECILPQHRLELSFLFLKTLQESGRQWSSDELALHHGCNKEHARRICRQLFHQKEIQRDCLPSTGGRRRWVYCSLDHLRAVGTFPT